MTIPKCCICKEDYTDENGDRIPKNLACDHSMCLDCAEQLVANGQIVCPWCRNTTNVENNDVKVLRKNFGLLQAIYDAKFALNQMARELKITSPPRCTVHTYNLAEFVCVTKTCESSDKLMCRTCEEFGVHKGHERGLLQDESERIRQMLRNAEEKLESMTSNTDELISASVKAQLSFSTESDDYKQKVMEINLHFDKMRRLVDEREEEALEMLRSLKSAQIEILQEKEFFLNDRREDILIQKKNLAEMLRFKNSKLVANKTVIETFCRAIQENQEFVFEENQKSLCEVFVDFPEFQCGKTTVRKLRGAVYSPVPVRFPIVSSNILTENMQVYGSLRVFKGKENAYSLLSSGFCQSEFSLGSTTTSRSFGVSGMPPPRSCTASTGTLADKKVPLVTTHGRADSQRMSFLKPEGIQHVAGINGITAESYEEL
ncbi:unnamed protein product [Caenorhabditis sp. 36 PRJEB53466]|nr:unnamed protein product [Caenorhabditis sp. 36 PRJEB53466]